MKGFVLLAIPLPLVLAFPTQYKVYARDCQGKAFQADVCVDSPSKRVNKTINEKWTVYDGSSAEEGFGNFESMLILDSSQSPDMAEVPANSTSQPYNFTKEAEELLTHILEELKSFIHEAHIDARGFEMALQTLTKEFNDICLMIDTLVTTSPPLQKQLNFTKNVFNALYFATQIFHQNPFSGGVCGFLVYSMVELNVRMYILFDKYGELDRSIEDCDDKIYGFWANMLQWHENFLELDLVPYESRRLFEDQQFQASRTIKEFWMQMR